MKTYIRLLKYLAKFFFLEWELFEDKICRENQNTDFIFSISENPVMYELIRKNIVESDRPQIYSTAHAEYLRLQTHSEYVKLKAFARHNNLR